MPSPVTPKWEQMMCPDCSPPRAAPCSHHRLTHLPVPNRTAYELHSFASKGGLEAEVRHDGGDNPVVWKAVFFLEGARPGKQDIVAVEYGAVFVNQDGSVSIAVEGETGVRACLYRGCERIGESRPDSGIDVHPVRRAGDRDDIGAELTEYVLCEA